MKEKKKNLKNKNGVFYVVISFIAVLGVVGAIRAFNGGLTGNNIEGDCVNCNLEAPKQSEASFGAASGPDYYFPQRFHSNYTSGGSYYATSSDQNASWTLSTTELASDFSTSFVQWDPGTNLALTTMASSSAPLVNLNVGEKYTVDVFNSGEAGVAITWTAGTGIDLQEDEGATVTQNGGEISRLTFLKTTTTDVLLWVEVGQVGD